MTETSIPLMIDTVTYCAIGQSAPLILYYWQVPVFERIHDNTSLLQQQPKQTWKYWTGCLYKQHSMYRQLTTSNSALSTQLRFCTDTSLL